MFLTTSAPAVERSVECDMSDEELTVLALAADPDQPLDADAQPASFLSDQSLLPTWYMPSPANGTGALGRGRTAIAWVLIAAFGVITALGSCVTYGQLIGWH